MKKNIKKLIKSTLIVLILLQPLQVRALRGNIQLNSAQSVWNRYFTDEYGNALTGWIYNEGWYKLDEFGRLITGWVHYNDEWYYLNANGLMQTGAVMFGNYWVTFRQNGIWDDSLNVMHNEIEEKLLELAQGREGIGISYLCLVTGRHITVNADREFFGASIIKLPTHMLIAEAVYEGRLSWNQVLRVEPSDWLGGSGVLQDRIQIGTLMTLEDVMRYSIVYSDNIAHRMLTRTLIPGFVHERIGLDNSYMHLTTLVYERFLRGATPSERMSLTPNQAMEFLRVLYVGRYDIEGFERIIHSMRRSSWNNRFATNLGKEYVAHTPGWTDPFEHDSGIFFTDNPFILVVMTEDTGGIPFLSEVADEILKINLNVQ